EHFVIEVGHGSRVVLLDLFPVTVLTVIDVVEQVLLFLVEAIDFSLVGDKTLEGVMKLAHMSIDVFTRVIVTVPGARRYTLRADMARPIMARLAKAMVRLSRAAGGRRANRNNLRQFQTVIGCY